MKRSDFGTKVVSVFVVSFLVTAAWAAVLFGRVKVKGYRRAYLVLKQGGTLVLSNHPSLPETLILPALFWLWGLTRNKNRIPWSVADEKLFGGNVNLYPAMRCIPVSREEPRKYPTSKSMLAHLKKGGNVCVYPESGRTAKGGSFITVGARKVASCNPGPARLAAIVDATVLPVWVDNPNADRPRSFPEEYRRLWRGPRLTITFGSPIKVSKEVEAEDVAHMLLNCGRYDP